MCVMMSSSSIIHVRRCAFSVLFAFSVEAAVNVYAQVCLHCSTWLSTDVCCTVSAYVILISCALLYIIL